MMNINRIVPILQESTSEVPNVPVREFASPADSANSPTIVVPSQIPDIESGPVIQGRNEDIES